MDATCKALSELADAFERTTREDGTQYYRIRESALAWIEDNDLMRKIHEQLDERLPDDWVYESVFHLASSLKEYDDPEDDAPIDEVVDSCVDVYDNQLIQWLASNSRNIALVDDACREGLVDTTTGLIDRIKAGQYRALELIATALLNTVRDIASNLYE